MPKGSKPMTRRVLTWLVLLVCLTVWFGLLGLYALLAPIDTRDDVADLALAGILRGAA